MGAETKRARMNALLAPRPAPPQAGADGAPVVVVAGDVHGVAHCADAHKRETVRVEPSARRLGGAGRHAHGRIERGAA